MLAFTASNWNSDRTWFAPAELLNSAVKNSIVNVVIFKPLAKVFSVSIDSYQAIVCPVIRLFFICTPTKVSNLVMPVIVDSVKTVVFAWPKTNIGNKLFSRISGAALNSAIQAIVSPTVKSPSQADFDALVNRIAQLEARLNV